MNIVLIWQLLIASAGVGAVFGAVSLFKLRTDTGARPRLSGPFGIFLCAYAIGSFMALYGVVNDPVCQATTTISLIRRSIEAFAVWLLVLQVTGKLNGTKRPQVIK